MTSALERSVISTDEIEHLLEESAVFGDLKPEARAMLVDWFEPILVPAGAVLMEQGDEADSLYLVTVGRLRVTMRRDDHTDVVLAELGRGEVVGEMALVTNDPRSATVAAVRDS